MPRQRESPEVSRPLPSEENKIGAFQMDSTNGSISKLSKHQWLDQKQNDSLASAGAAGVSVACKTQFWVWCASFQRENRSRQSKLTGHNPWGLLLSANNTSGLLWDLRDQKKHPITCKPFDASAAGASVLACKQLIVEEKRQRHQN